MSDTRNHPSRAAPGSPPPSIPNHELLECIGLGSYGEVWRARSIMGTERAVKIVRRAHFDSERPYEREFSGIQKFEPVSRSHPGVVDVLHVGRNDDAGFFYYIMELADPLGPVPTGTSPPPDEPRATHGPAANGYLPATLRAVLRAHGRLPAADCLKLGEAVADALAHLHRHGLVHRDIKPSNIIFVGGRPKLADIGLVAAMDEAKSFVGTEGYIAPEGPGTAQADLYSLGKVLYEAATGKDRHDFPALPESFRGTPEGEAFADLNETLLRACAPVPKQRFPSAEAMRAELLLLASGRSIRGLRANERLLQRLKLSGLVGTTLLVIATGTALFLKLEARKAALLATQESRQRRLIEEKELALQRTLYAANMNLAAEALRINSLRRTRELLEGHKPKAGGPDFRHWEWSYLRQAASDYSDGSCHLPGAVFNRLGVAPDGRTLAVPCGKDGIQLWDLATRQVRAHLPVPCYQAFYSPRSRWVAAVVSQINRVDVFNAETAGWAGSVLRDRQVNDVAFSPDESLLAVTSDEYAAGSRLHLRLWRWQDSTLLGQRSFPAGHESHHFKLAFHPDGRRLAISDGEGNVRLLRSTDLADEQTLKVEEGVAGAIAISHDGRWLVAATQTPDTPLRLWNLETCTPATSLRNQSAVIQSLAFSPDSRWLAAGGVDETIKVLSLPQLALAATLRGHTRPLRTVGFLGDNQMLASGDSSGEIRFWAVAEVRADPNDVTLPPLLSPALTTDFRQFCGINSNRVVVLGDTFPAPAPVELPQLGTDVRLVTMTPDAHLIASVDRADTLRIWRRSDGQVKSKPIPSEYAIARLGFVGNGKFLVSLDDEGYIKRWTPELEVARRFTMPVGFLMDADLKVNPLDFMFCSTTSGRKVISLEDGHLLATPESRGGALGGNALSHDGRVFAAGNQDGQVEFYDTATWRRLGEPLPCHSDWLWSVAFSPDGRRLATGGEGREAVRLWDVESRQQVCTLPVEPSGVAHLWFSADGRSLAFSNPARRLRIITVELPK